METKASETTSWSYDFDSMSWQENPGLWGIYDSVWWKEGHMMDQCHCEGVGFDVGGWHQELGNPQHWQHHPALNIEELASLAPLSLRLRILPRLVARAGRGRVHTFRVFIIWMTSVLILYIYIYIQYMYIYIIHHLSPNIYIWCSSPLLWESQSLWTVTIRRPSSSSASSSSASSSSSSSSSSSRLLVHHGASYKLPHIL